jgi:hypothetical protein
MGAPSLAPSSDPSLLVFCTPCSASVAKPKLGSLRTYTHGRERWCAKAEGVKKEAAFVQWRVCSPWKKGLFSLLMG